MSDADIMAMSGIASSALQVAGNITASTFGYRKTKELAQFQNDLNIANWNMQNQYNSPSAQMDRLRQAGLNPNLMYGQGNTGNASNISSPTLHNPGFKNPFEGVDLMRNYQEMKSVALSNERQRILNDEEYLKYAQRVRSENILRLFASDKTGGVYTAMDLPDKNGFQLGGDLLPSKLRETPEYKVLQSMYNKGDISDATLQKLLTGNNILGATEERNRIIEGMLSGNTQLTDIMRFIIVSLITSMTAPSTVGHLFN